MSLFRNASIGLKISLAPGFTVLCMLLLAGVAWLGSSAMMQSLATVSHVNLPRLVQAQALDSGLRDIQRQLMQTLSWEAIGQKQERIDALDKQIRDALTVYDKNLKAALASPGLSADEIKSLEALSKQYTVYQKTALETLDIKSAGVGTAASFVFTLDAAYADGSKALAAFSKAQQEQILQAAADAEQQAATQQLIMGCSTLVAVLAAAAIAWFVQLQISRPLSQAATIARTVADGDLTSRVDVSSSDATGQVLAAMGDMQANLVRLISQVRKTADSIATASSEIASGSADLSQRTEQQAAALEETSASMQDMTQTVQHNADSAQQANQLAHSAAQVADRGGEVVSRVVETMNDISGSSHKIAAIIGVIDGIAFQTNILALNAAVEAARAGEQGRGFAVVASEVRSLAQRSAEAAKEIKQLIDDSVSKVENGATLVSEAGETMTEIMTQVRRVTGLIGEINASSSQQSSGISQVNQVIGTLDNGTQQNAALVEQSAAAAESLKQQAAELMKLVSVFHIAQQHT